MTSCTVKCNGASWSLSLPNLTKKEFLEIGHALIDFSTPISKKIVRAMSVKMIAEIQKTDKALAKMARDESDNTSHLRLVK